MIIILSRSICGVQHLMRMSLLKEMMTKCDECGVNQADSTHIFLKQAYLCSDCGNKVKDDEVSGECEDCGEHTLDCRCDRFTIQDAYDQLNEVHDLSTCLFILLHHPGMKDFPGNPHGSLSNVICEKVHYITHKLKDIHE